MVIFIFCGFPESIIDEEESESAQKGNDFDEFIVFKLEICVA